MSEAKFLHFDLKLTDLIIELDYLRKKPLGGSTHPKVFFQLKHNSYTRMYRVGNRYIVY